eukprot:TRINITY_DN2185_c1_g1_i1.p1 TRINITY_DN2185_c1_g1~~TRINITY_DN2185_c1_g1_i1.p1  ORF type:complete len:493 (-),score=86.97 TRINITY_DN2185_c1_g1_i1:423-1901(-)
MPTCSPFAKPAGKRLQALARGKDCTTESGCVDPPQQCVPHGSPLDDVLHWLDQSDAREYATFTALSRQESTDLVDDVDDVPLEGIGRGVGDDRPGLVSTVHSHSKHPKIQSQNQLQQQEQQQEQRRHYMQRHHHHFNEDESTAALLPKSFGGRSGSSDARAGAAFASPRIPTSSPRRSRGSPRTASKHTVDAWCLPAAGCHREPLEERASPEEEEEREWALRQSRTGTVGRLVSYSIADRPQEDFLLRGGNGGHVVVAAVRDGGRASKVGVKSGDRLVSIDGRKDFLTCSADAIRDGLVPPTVLVFLGFVGKLQAEVRLTPSKSVCGMREEEMLSFSSESPFALYDQRVFNPASSSIFLVSAEPRADRQVSVGVAPCKDVGASEESASCDTSAPVVEAGLQPTETADTVLGHTEAGSGCGKAAIAAQRTCERDNSAQSEEVANAANKSEARTADSYGQLFELHRGEAAMLVRMAVVPPKIAKASYVISAADV